MALRYYTERIDAARVQRTPSGMVRVDATVAKAGVYSYTNPDGSVTREYLPAEEITRADSLASLEDVTVTNRHPANMVDPNTWGSVSIGHARNAKSDGTGKDTTAGATLVIAKADAQSKIGTDLVEVSRGVTVRVDPTPGVTPWGEKYDAVQRDVVYNHIAVGPRGWNRQGPDVAMRLDAAGDEMAHDCCANCKDKHDAGETPAPKETLPMKIKHNGKEYEFKTDAEAQAFIDALPATPAPVTGPTAAELEAAKGAAAAEKARADSAQARLDAIEAERKQAARAALETQAKAVLGVDRFDSAQTERSIREQVLAKLLPAIKCDGQSDDYVRAAYDAALVQAPPVASENRSDAMIRKMYGIREDGRSELTDKERKDAQDKLDAQDRHRARTEQAYRQPLTLSKDAS